MFFSSFKLKFIILNWYEIFKFIELNTQLNPVIQNTLFLRIFFILSLWNNIKLWFVIKLMIKAVTLIINQWQWLP